MIDQTDIKTVPKIIQPKLYDHVVRLLSLEEDK